MLQVLYDFNYSLYTTHQYFGTYFIVVKPKLDVLHVCDIQNRTGINIAIPSLNEVELRDLYICGAFTRDEITVLGQWWGSSHLPIRRIGRQFLPDCAIDGLLDVFELRESIPIYRFEFTAIFYIYKYIYIIINIYIYFNKYKSLL